MGAHTALRLAVGNLNIHPSRYALPTVKVARLKLFLPKGQLAPEAPSKVSDKVGEEEENILGTLQNILGTLQNILGTLQGERQGGGT